MSIFSRKSIALFSLVVVLVGLIFSPVVLSIGMFGVGLMAAFDIKSGRIGLSTEIKHHWGLFLRNRGFSLLILVFLVFFVSGIYSENPDYWLERVRIKAPFLGLPVAFFFLPKFTGKEYRGLGLFFVIMLALTAIGVTLNYLWHLDTINTLLKQGQFIPTPRNHIRFSLGIAISIMVAIGLYLDKEPIFRGQRVLVAFLGIWLFIFQHILAVRSGLVGLYIGLGVFIVASLFVPRYRRLGLLSIIVMVGMAWFGYQAVPSLRTKIQYTIWDWKMWMSDQGKNYSDSERLTSIQYGLDIGRKHPWIGIGVGDVRDEMNRLYDQNQNVSSKRLIPHNQFVYVFAGTGIIGLFFFMIGLLAPIFYNRNYRNVLFMSIQAILWLSFLVETTLETSMGTGHYLFWSLLLLIWMRDRKR